MIASFFFLLLPIINIISRRLRWSVQLNITALSLSQEAPDKNQIKQKQIFLL